MEKNIENDKKMMIKLGRDFAALMNELYEDETGHYLDSKINVAKDGGCYDLYKLVHEVVPEVELYINKKRDHYVWKFSDNLYDWSGDIDKKEYSNYTPANDIDIAMGEGISKRLYDGLYEHGVSFYDLVKKEYLDIVDDPNLIHKPDYLEYWDYHPTKAKTR